MQFVSVKRFSEDHDISEEMTRKLIAKRALSVVRIGRCVRIALEEVRRFHDRNTVPAEQE